MATALFVSIDDIKRNSIIDGNVDPDKIIQFCKLGQRMHLENYLGTKLYNRISDDIIAGNLSGDYLELKNDYIAPMLIHFAMVEYLYFAPYTLKNGGLYKHSSENSQVPDKSEVDFLAQQHRSYAEFYTRRFIEHLAFNHSKFPEYNQNNKDDMHPDKTANFVGWVF